MRLLYKATDEHEFRPLLAEIEDRPVSPLGRSIFWLVICTILFFTVWTTVGEVDVVVSATGKVIPDGESKVIQPLDTGIIADILVKEGDYVRKGQPLIEVDPSSIQPEVESSAKGLSYARLEVQRLKSTLYGSEFNAGTGDQSESASTQTDLLDAARNTLQKQILSKEEELEQVNQQMMSTKVEKADNQQLLTVAQTREARLSSVLDFIARDEYDKVTSEITSYQNKIQEADYKLVELQHRMLSLRQEIEQSREQFKTDNLKELAERQKQITEIQAKLKESTFRSSKQILCSPINGHVSRLFVHTVGGVVTPAEKLIAIVPDKTPLLIQADVLNKDVGFVKNGLPAAIKVDTFDFQKYGMVDGKVKLVSHDSKEDEKLGQIYDAYITPVNDYLMVDGQRQRLTAGMTVVAEIKVGKRKIIEFFIYPLIKYLHEGMSVR